MSRYLGRATEHILLYVEGRPGVHRTWVLTYLAAGHTPTPEAAARAVARMVTAGLVESYQESRGGDTRLWITRAGLSLLHGVDYAAPAVA